MLHVEWYHVCWPRLTAKRVEPVVSISWASCLFNVYKRFFIFVTFFTFFLFFSGTFLHLCMLRTLRNEVNESSCLGCFFIRSWCGYCYLLSGQQWNDTANESHCGLPELTHTFSSSVLNVSNTWSSCCACGESYRRDVAGYHVCCGHWSCSLCRVYSG